MKEWFTAAELTQFHAMPASKTTVLEMAKSKCWLSRSRMGNGGGLEFHITSLPKETQRALRISEAKKAAATQSGLIKEDNEKRLSRLQASLAEYMTLPKTQKALVDARTEVVLAVAEIGVGVDAFLESYNKGELSLSEDVRKRYPSLNRATVFRWIKKYNEEGVASLASKRGIHRKKTGVIDQDEALKTFIIGMLVEHPHLSNVVLYKAIQMEFKNTVLPTLRTVERWIAKWKHKNQQLYTAVTNPDKWKNKYMAAFGSASEDVTELNQLWEFDSTPADLLLQDGNRYNILGVIDVYSRRLILIVSRTSNSKAVAQVIRKAIVDWGIPQIAKTDNGADYKSKYIQTVFGSLGIQQEFCPPFQAWKKPHIERVFKSFSHHLLELLPGFAGHNVAERKDIEARKQFSDRLFQKDTVIEVGLSSTELQAFCDSWIENHYHITKHSELKKTPNQMVRDWPGTVRKIEDERVLDVLLSEPVGTRTVTKHGISIDGGTYIHSELAVHMGEEVHVFYDETDMGHVYVYNTENEFICIATDPTLKGVSRIEVAQKAKARQKEVVQERRRELKATAKQISKRDIAQEILADQAAKARAEKVSDFPRPSEHHSSDGLAAAADALNAKDGVTQTGMTEEQMNEIKQLQAEIFQPDFSRKPLPDDMAEKYLLWVSLDEKAKAGLEIETGYQGFYESFPRSSEFESGKMLAELRQQTSAS